MIDGGESRFPASMRLKKRTDFQRVFRKGVVWVGPCFALHVLPRTSGPRLGIVVSRKYGNAVARNRVKRRIREAFRINAGTLPAVDLIVRPTAACRELSVDGLARMLVDGVNRSIDREDER